MVLNIIIYVKNLYKSLNEGGTNHHWGAVINDCK